MLCTVLRVSTNFGSNAHVFHYVRGSNAEWRAQDTMRLRIWHLPAGGRPTLLSASPDRNGQRFERPLDFLVPVVFLQRFFTIKAERLQHGGVAV